MRAEVTALPIFLGVDGGSSKTHALLADERGQALALGRGGCGNWEGIGVDAAYEAHYAAFHEAIARAGLTAADITASAFGLSGLDWPSDVPILDAMVARLGIPGPRVLVNDAFVALRAGTTQPWGVAIIAGTGSIKAGRNRAGETARTLGLGGGEGSDWGDWGGGADITRAALAGIAQAYIGLGPETIMSNSLVRFAGVPDVESLLRGVTREGLRLRGATRLVFEAAAAGDAVAHAVLVRSAQAIGRSANLVIRKLHMEAEDFELVLAGSVSRNAQGSIWMDTLLDVVHSVEPKAQPLLLDAPPATGGVLLAMEAAGLQPGLEVRARLLETARALEAC
ncbi:MAG: BadF/BadG/BcrA/BcrD ATPase family protein [Anaerolineae bacterium]